MHLFAPERPESSPGTKALLLDGSAVPTVLLQPIDVDTVRLMSLLHNYDKHGGYSYRHVDIKTWHIALFYEDYMNDPEATLARYFGWIAQIPPAGQSGALLSLAKPQRAEAMAVATPMDDLL